MKTANACPSMFFVGLSYFGGIILIDKLLRNACQPLSVKI